MSNSTPSTKQLFQSAQSAGNISQQSVQALTVVDVSAQINAAMGVPALNIPASEVVLVSQMPDDSGSMASKAKLACEGHNLVLDALDEARVKDNVLAHTRYLNGQVLFPFCQLDQSVKMSLSNYFPSGNTPLYKQSLVLLATVLLKAQEFEDNGVPVRTISLIITDGGENASGKIRVTHVRQVVEDMLRAENHIIAGMGIDDGYTDFQQVFSEMGILPGWVLTPGNSEKEIRAAFRTFSKASAQASSSTAGFAALGGFVTP